ncbi:MAG: CotH kinase family protein, partial [Clostridia bacterium]|nr:CotH kinase family protein [Clostridia bacterium]
MKAFSRFLRRLIPALLCATLVFDTFSAFSAAGASSDGGVSVAEVDIRITADDYERLTKNASKVRYPTLVGIGSKAARSATVNIRGNFTKRLGIRTSSRRIPFELVFSDGNAFDGVLNNKDVKFISSFSLYFLLAEYIGLELFESMSIPTPEHELSFVSFNGVDFSLYLAVEDTNKRFFKKNFGKNVGCAYKSTDYNKEAEIIDTDWFGPLFVKTGTDTGALDRLLTALDSGEGYEQYIDVDEWLRFFACVSATGAVDSILDNRRNFILYEHGGVFDLVPWDLSDAFCASYTEDGIDRFTSGKKETSVFDLLMRDPENREKYHDYIRGICGGFLSPESIEPLFRSITESLEPYILRDGCTPLCSPEAVGKLLDPVPGDRLSLLYVLGEFRENLLAQLDGREDAFFVSTAYEEFYNISNDEADLFALWESLMPEGHAELPAKIIAAAPASVPPVTTAQGEGTDPAADDGAGTSASSTAEQASVLPSTKEPDPQKTGIPKAAVITAGCFAGAAV